MRDTLKTLFRKGLLPELQTELSCHDEGKDLDKFIELAIHIDNLICSQRTTQRTTVRSFPTPAAKKTELMQLNNSHLSTEERNCD